MNQHVLVEQFIPGREFTVGLLGNGHDVEVLPIVELDLEGDAQAIRVDEGRNPRRKICPATLDADKAAEIQRLTRGAFLALGLCDYGRADLRMDSEGKPYVLEINSMADLGRDGAYVCAAQAAGYTFESLINRVLDVAAVRHFGEGHSDDRAVSVAMPEKVVDPLAVRVRGYLRSQAPTLEDALRHFVNGRSRSRAVERVATQLRAVGLRQADPGTEAGDSLYFSNHANERSDVLLVARAHAAESTRFHELREEGSRLFGSGIAGTHGPTVVLLGALQSLDFARVLRDVRCGVLLVSSDELVDPDNESLVASLAHRAACVFGVSTTDVDGSLISSRSGRLSYRLVMTYPETTEPPTPVAAVAAFCTRVMAIHALDDPEAGVRVGLARLRVVGAFDGPGELDARIVVAFNDREQGPALDRQVKGLTEQRLVPGLRIEVNGGLECKPMAENQATGAVLGSIGRAAEDLNVRVRRAHRWTPSDACFVPDEVVAIDGFGPAGGNVRAGEEWVQRHSLVDRAALLALAIHDRASQ